VSDDIPEVVEPAIDYRHHFSNYATDCLKIANKDGLLVPLRLNSTQRFVLEQIRLARKAGRPPRIIVLKSRQVGVSTLAEALLFHACHLCDNRSALVLAHNIKSARAIFRMTKRFLENLPPEMKPKRKLDNVHEIHFSENDSRLQVEVTGEVRGYTAQYVHLSELAFYDNDAETLRSVMQSVPRSTDSLVVIESTANGVGNKFHELWVNAIRDSQDRELPDWERGWTPVFIPWFRHEEYRIKPWFLREETTQEEEDIMRRLKIALDRIAWRRWCLKTNCDGDRDTFNVEYPETWKSAFLLSGRPVFDKDGMAYCASQVPPEKPDALLPSQSEVDWDESAVGKKTTIYEVEGGRLRVYFKPQDRHTYIIGADPSEGDPGSDPTPLAVLDQMTLNCAAVWHGREPPDVLAKYAVWLGFWFNTALLVNEANNHGIDFHNTVLRMMYPNLYFRETSEESVSGEKVLKPGWYQTNKAKHFAINTFRKLVREKVESHRDDHTRLILDPTLVGEMGTLIYRRPKDRLGYSTGQTTIEAQPGHHKDCVMAFAIALAVHRGAEEAPLEPLPEAAVHSAALEAMRLRERDPDAAERFALDMTGLTCDDLQRLSDERHSRRMRQEALGLGLMR